MVAYAWREGGLGSTTMFHQHSTMMDHVNMIMFDETVYNTEDDMHRGACHQCARRIMVHVGRTSPYQRYTMEVV